MVWAHLKLDTNNVDDIVPYLKRSINEYPDEALNNLNHTDYAPKDIED